MARIDDLEKGLVDQYGVAIKAELDANGNEVGDPTPVAPPAHLRRSPTMSEQIQTMIRRQLSLTAQEQGYESFEEAEDFDVDDDPVDPHTPYEAVFDPQPPVTPEVGDGPGALDERRQRSASGGSGKSDKVGKGKSGKKQSADDEGSVPETDTGVGGSEGED